MARGSWFYAMCARQAVEAARNACLADDLPDWLVAMVVLRVKDAIMLGDWPLECDHQSSE